MSVQKIAPLAADGYPLGVRIAWAMVFRVVLITVLLGTTLVMYYDSLLSVQTPSLRTLLGIIGFTYLVTIIYGLWHRIQIQYKLLAYVQFVIDTFICGVLSYATGGISSGFNFLFHLWVIVAAVVLVGRAAYVISAVSALVLVAISIAMSTGFIQPLPPFSGNFSYNIPLGETVYFLVVNIVSLFLVAALVTSLISRIEATGKGLEEEREQRKDLSILHSDTVRCLPVGLATTDHEGRILDMNPEGRKLLGMNGLVMHGALLGKWLPEFGDYAGANRATGKIHGKGICADGTSLPVEFTVTPLVDAEGAKKGTIVSFNDLSLIKRLEVALERAGRLAALGELAAGLAHEIRNPLSAVSGSFQMLSNHPSFSEEDRSLSNIISRELERIERLVSDMLDYARPREPVRSAAELTLVAGEIVTAFCKGIEDDLEVLFVDDLSVTAMIDGNQIKQLIWNLLRNAAQAIGGQGTISVSVKDYEDAYVALEIDDSGPGIKEEELKKIFDPFYTTREQGVGLGLSICDRIAKDHGGKIEVHRSELGGALIRVILAKK